MRTLITIAGLSVVAALSLCACGHHPIEAVKAGGVALDVYVDEAAVRLEAATEDAVAMCNERSNSQEEYFDCMAPMNATLAKAEAALRHLVKGQAAAFDAMEAAEDFEAALREAR